MNPVAKLMQIIFKRPCDAYSVTAIAMILLPLIALLACFHFALGGDVRTVKLNQTMVAKIFISPGRSTILSFPTRPTKVILGNQGVYALEYVENDLAIAALSAHSNSDLFVYLDGRRFAFDLATVPSGGDTIVLVRDSLDEPDPVKGRSALKEKSKRPRVQTSHKTTVTLLRKPQNE